MPDNIQPGQTISPNDGGAGSDKPAAGFTPAPNPFDQPTSSGPSPAATLETPPAPKPPIAEPADEPAKSNTEQPTQPAPPVQPQAQTEVAQTSNQVSTAPTVAPVVNNTADADQVPEEEETIMGWQAPEFVQTQKPVGWYVVMIVFFVALSILAIVTQQYLAIGLFALVGFALAIYANRKPRILGYGITTLGVQVGKKSYNFDDFSGFSQSSDYGQVVFDLTPTKRFGTLISLPAPKDQVDEIDDVLGDFLPKTESHEDWIDKLFKYLRF
jgi:hypothetical protein